MAFVKQLERVARLFFQLENQTAIEVHGKKSRALDILQDEAPFTRPYWPYATPALIYLVLCLQESGMASWKWVLGACTAVMSVIAAPVGDSLVKEGKFPDGLGAVLSKLWSWISLFWEWLNGQTSMPTWVALMQIVALIAFVIPLIWLLLPNDSASAQAAAPTSLEATPDQLAVFLFVGRSIDNDNEVNLDVVIRSVGLSRNATEHALELLVESDLISCHANFYGPDWYQLTNAGRARYLELERDAASIRT